MVEEENSDFWEFTFLEAKRELFLVRREAAILGATNLLSNEKFLFFQQRIPKTRSNRSQTNACAPLVKFPVLWWRSKYSSSPRALIDLESEECYDYAMIVVLSPATAPRVPSI